MNAFSAVLSHRTFVPLLFVASLVWGWIALGAINKQLWPDYQASYGVVSISWPNAPIAAVDTEISRRLDATLNGVKKISEVSTTAHEGRASAFFKIDVDSDASTTIREVEQAVRGIWALPPDTRPAVVRLVEPADTVARLMVSGNFDRMAAKALMEDVISTLNENGVSRVRHVVPDLPSIVIDVDQRKMQAHGLNADQIEAKVQSFFSNPDSFSIQSEENVVPVELTLNSQSEFVGDLELSKSPARILLSDIARFSTSSQANTVQPVYRAGTGFFLQVERAPGDDLLDLNQALIRAVETLRSAYPSTVQFQIFDVEAESLERRIVVLVENALVGVALVFAVLLIGVGFFPAFWVSVGLCTTFALSVGVMHMTGQTINYVSVFAMIMVVGILVDDAIVVSERIAFFQAEGRGDAPAAAVAKTWKPVLVSTATTVVGFAPILLLRDSIGSYVAAIPLFVCTALLVSYFECFVLLPHHMRKPRKEMSLLTVMPVLGRIFSAVSKLVMSIVKLFSGMGRFVSGVVATAILLGSLASVALKPPPFKFWLNPQTNIILAYINLPAGAAQAEARATMLQVWDALDQAEADMTGAMSVTVSFGIYGQHFMKPGQEFDPSRNTLFVELSADTTGGATTQEFIAKWRENIAVLNTAAEITVEEQKVGLGGADVEITLTHTDLDNLKSAAQDLAATLRDQGGLSDVTNSLFGSRAGFVIQSKDSTGFMSGIETDQLQSSILRSLRQASSDASPGNSEQDWILRFGDPDNPQQTLNDAVVGGSQVRLGDAVELAQVEALTPLTRKNGKLSAAVKATFSGDGPTETEIRAAIENEILPRINYQHGTSQSIGGLFQVSDDTLRTVGIASLLAFALMFAILAVSFGDYLRPVIVLITLPVGAVAGVLGHALLGYPVTLLSLVAFLGLSGILVNDMVLLVDTFEGHLKAGRKVRDAIVDAYRDRLRPIVLTSTTTTLGLLPLMLDSDPEAQFLIPIAISIVFGLTFAMFTTLFLFPTIAKALISEPKKAGAQGL